VRDLAGDLDWWRANRAAPDIDHGTMREVLARLRAWKAEHDKDRAGQPGPFLQLAWDAVFGDEHARVATAIAEIERLLGA